MTQPYNSADLTKYNAAKQALAAAVRVDEVKDIRDKAVAIRVYAMQAKDRVLIDQATEIRMRAERRAGELLSQMEKNQGAVPGKTGRKGKPVLDNTPKLADLGINKTQSSRWQDLAKIDEANFDKLIASAKRKASNAINQSKPRDPEPKPHKDPIKEKIDICVRKVESAVRYAMPWMDAKQQKSLLDQITAVIDKVMAEQTSIEKIVEEHADRMDDLSAGKPAHSA